MKGRAEKRQYILDLLAHYTPLLGLEDWDFKVEFYNTTEDMKLGERASAGCSAQSDYKNAVLSFALDALPPELLDRTVVHELTHCLLWPMTHYMDRWAGEDAEKQEISRYQLEYVTADLDRILTRHLPSCQAPLAPAKARRNPQDAPPVRGSDPQGDQEAEGKGSSRRRVRRPPRSPRRP